MLNKLLNKKVILLLLIIIFILISYSNYIKTTADSSFKDQFFSQQTENEKDAAEKRTADRSTMNNSTKNNTIKAALSDEKVKADNDPAAAADEAERIALIAEVKDPFFKDQKSYDQKEEVLEKEIETEPLNLNYSENLLFSEREIMSRDLNKEINQEEQQEAKNLNESEKSKENNEQNDTAAAEKKPAVNIDNLNLPFELIGTVKNKKEAAAVFNYQGQTVVIKEKGKIDIFKIEKIENKKIIISLENQNLELKLWGADELES